MILKEEMKLTNETPHGCGLFPFDDNPICAPNAKLSFFYYVLFIWRLPGIGPRVLRMQSTPELCLTLSPGPRFKRMIHLCHHTV